jgi:UDP-N-acetyl-D-mannosaminuronate dehydrogenase
VLIVLVDHDLFKSVPLAERADKIVYDSRGIWPDQPCQEPATSKRHAGRHSTGEADFVAKRRSRPSA